MSHSHLKILVTDDSISLQYIVGDEVLVSHNHNFGIKHLESHALSKQATSKFLDSIIYTLEFISLHDRIPTDFRLTATHHSSWLKNAIENNSYAQFFTDGIPVRVTLDNNKDNLLNNNYAGHKKAILSFKI